MSTKDSEALEQQRQRRNRINRMKDGNHCDDYGMDACLTVGNYPSDGAGSTFEQPCKETGESGTDNRFAKYSGF